MDLLRSLVSNFLGNLHLVAGLVAFWLVDFLAQRRLKRLSEDRRNLSALSMWLGVGALLGARIVYLLPTPTAFYLYPQDIIRVNAGLSLYGALTGGSLAALLFQRLRGFPFLPIADAYVTFLPLGIALFRLTCFLHGPCWGRATESFLGVQFPSLTVPRYPSELYEGLLALGLFAVLLHVSSQKPRPGLLFASFLMEYAAIRWLIDMTRIQVGFWSKVDPWLAAAMGLIGFIGILAVLRWSRFAAVPSQATRPSRRGRAETTERQKQQEQRCDET